MKYRPGLKMHQRFYENLQSWQDHLPTTEAHERAETYALYWKMKYLEAAKVVKSLKNSNHENMNEETVRAKFKVNSIVDYGPTSSRQFRMSAIYGKEGENAGFAKWTPSGSLEIMVENETYAAKNWQVGDEFYLNFQKVPKP